MQGPTLTSYLEGLYWCLKVAMIRHQGIYNSFDLHLRTQKYTFQFNLQIPTFRRLAPLCVRQALGRVRFTCQNGLAPAIEGEN